ncbi:MAG: hypothetical protein K6E56_06150 [Lachnospiraceae bacterium]|nr:hypothetical protein [Lachnospiraceae bacterium]
MKKRFPEKMSESEMARAFRINSKTFVIAEDAGQVSDVRSLITSEIKALTSSWDAIAPDESDYDLIFRGDGYGYFAHGSSEVADNLLDSIKVMTDSVYSPEKFDSILVALTGPVSMIKANDIAETLTDRLAAENCICRVWDGGTEEKVSISIFG